MKFILPILSLIVACVGVFWVCNPQIKISNENLLAKDYLKSTIPDKFSGAVSVEKPLGQTEEVIRATEKALVVSDYLNREYTLSNGKKITLYISYWKRSKETVERASTHTPDRCWIKNGWSCNSQTRRNADIITVGDKQLLPARYGEYSISDNGRKITRYVWYWFVVDSKIYQFTSENYVPSPIQWLKNALTSAVADAPEMYFIRIDSDYQLDQFRTNPEFQELLNCLGDMILFDKHSQKQEGNNNAR